MTMVAPEKRIRCNGKVTIWTYDGKYSRPFRAIIFRPVEGSQTQFKIIGINDIPAGTANGLVYYSVPEANQISVKYGDVIGWSSGDSVITFNTDQRRVSPVWWLSGNLHDDLVTDQILDFNSGNERRAYSIEAYAIETNDTGKNA